MTKEKIAQKFNIFHVTIILYELIEVNSQKNYFHFIFKNGQCLTLYDKEGPIRPLIHGPSTGQTNYVN